MGDLYALEPVCFSALFRNMRSILLSQIPSELRWLSGQIRPYVALHFASFFCTAGASLLAVITPLVLKWLIDAVLPRRQFGLVLVAAALVFVSYFGKNTLTNLLENGNFFLLLLFFLVELCDPGLHLGQKGLTLRLEFVA